MKKISIILLVLSIIMILAACGDPSDGTTADTESDDSDAIRITVREVKDLASYTIVRGDKSSDTEKGAASELRRAISEKMGIDLNIATDFAGVNTHEIIVGEANRSLVQGAFEELQSDYDYIIRTEGGSIVILGATPEATAEAVSFFIKNFIVDGKLYSPSGSGYVMLEDSPIKKLTVDGKDISEYKFYYLKEHESTTTENNLSFVEKAMERLGKKTGIRFTLSDSFSVNQNYIMVDTTELNYTKGAVRIENGNIILYGSYHSIDYVMDYFFDTMLGDKETVELTSGTTELDSGDLPDIYSKDDLMKVLEYSYNDNGMLIVGDQIRGLRTSPDFWLDVQMNGGFYDDINYVGTGKYPAILGVDLGRCGLRLPFIDESQWYIVSQIVCELVDYAAEGGIVTISSHFANPTGYEADWRCDRGNLGSAQGWADLITEGTEINTEFKKELEMNARVLKALSDAGVPVIWRPMHEMNTPSFWFCIGATGETLDASCYVNAWRYIYEYFTEEWGIDTMIWNYCPNQYNSNKIDVMYCYPGDEYVDIVAIDWYTGGKYEIGKEHNPYGTLMNAGKITNLGEVGISDELVAENYNDQHALYSAKDFFGNFTAMLDDGYKIGYMLTFNSCHTFAYLPEGDEIMASELVIDLSEMPALFEKAAGYKIGS